MVIFFFQYKESEVEPEPDDFNDGNCEIIEFNEHVCLHTGQLPDVSIDPLKHSPQIIDLQYGQETSCALCEHEGNLNCMTDCPNLFIY